MSSPVARAATGAKAVKESCPTGKSSVRINSIKPSASRTPSPSPIAAPRTPSRAASRSTEPVIRPAPGPQGAQHADLPRPLEDGHVEGVEDQEAADEQGHRGEEVEDRVEALELRLDVGAFLARRLDLDSARQAATQVVLDAGDRLLAAGDHEVHLVPDARPVHHPARRAERHRGEALPAEVEPGRELEQAHHSQSLDAGGGREPHAVAEVDPVGVGPAALEVDLQPVAWPAPRDRAGVGELGGPGALAGDVQLLGGVGRGRAGAIDEGEDAEHDSLRLLDAGRAPDLAER